MTGNHALLQDFKLKNGTHVAFGGDAGGKITGEGIVSNGIISFDKVNYCAQLNFNLLSVSQICDKKYLTLFDESFCYILKPGFKIPEDWVVIKAPRDRDVYKLDMSQVDAETETICLIAQASNDESQLWHRRLGHSNFRNINKLVSGNHAVGIPSKKFVGPSGSRFNAILIVYNNNTHDKNKMKNCQTPFNTCKNQTTITEINKLQICLQYAPSTQNHAQHFRVFLVK